MKIGRNIVFIFIPVVAIILFAFGWFIINLGLSTNYPIDCLYYFAFATGFLYAVLYWVMAKYYLDEPNVNSDNPLLK